MEGGGGARDTVVKENNNNKVHPITDQKYERSDRH